MMTLEQMNEAIQILQLDREALQDELRQLRGQMDLLIDNSVEWIRPAETMSILGIKSTHLESIRKAGTVTCPPCYFSSHPCPSLHPLPAPAKGQAQQVLPSPQKRDIPSSEQVYP